VTAELRAPTPGDVPEVARLMSVGFPEPVDEDAVRRMWSRPSFDPALDARIEADAYAFVEPLGEGRVWIDLRGRPSSDLLDWAERRARESATRLFSGAWATNDPLLAELERRGFDVVRYSQRMTVDLDGAGPDPDWPDGLSVRTFQEGDERVFYETHQETFADIWEPVDQSYDEWSRWLLETPTFDPRLWFLAVAGDEPAGFAICNVRPGDPELGWIQILGVRREWRGRGLGRALLLQAFAEFRQLGLRRAGLGVDAESPTGANRLYESVGMREAARFEVREKVTG
jgi:ribosomal protein S18 acetylase RimI-like enzyme